MDGSIDDPRLAMSLWLLKVGGGYVGVYSTVLVNLMLVPSHNIKSLREKSLKGNIL